MSKKSEDNLRKACTDAYLSLSEIGFRVGKLGFQVEQERIIEIIKSLRAAVKGAQS